MSGEYLSAPSSLVRLPVSPDHSRGRIQSLGFFSGAIATGVSLSLCLIGFQAAEGEAPSQDYLPIRGASTFRRASHDATPRSTTSPTREGPVVFASMTTSRTPGDAAEKPCTVMWAS